MLKHLVRYALIAAFALAPSLVLAQVKQSGTVTPGHVAQWLSSGVIKDGGSATNGFITNFGIFANGGLPDCITASTIPRASFDPASSPYTQLCRYANQGGAGGLTLNSYNGAASANFNININGTDYPFPASGSGTGNVTGPGSSTVGDFACWNNTSGTLLADCTGSITHVATNAALKSTAGVAGKAVMRDGFTAANDSPAVYYVFSGTTCSINAGAGDNGSQVAPNAANGCWLATFVGNVADVRVFGAVCDGSTDDTATFVNANLSGLSLSIPEGKTCAIKNWSFNGPGLFGVPGKSTLTLASTGTTSDFLTKYTGAGPLTVSGVSFSCPFYNPSTGAAPAGTDGLLIETSSGNTSNITILHTQFAGCQQQFRALLSQNLYIDDMVNDRPQGFGWIVSDALDTLTNNTQHIFIKNTRGYAAGQFCGSLPANLPSGVILAPRVIDVRGVHCENSGFLASKLCFDVTGTADDQIYFEGTGTNCSQGGVEVKKSADNTSAIAGTIANQNINMTYYSNIDLGGGIAVAFGLASSNPDLVTQLNVNGFVTYTTPNACNASTYYNHGAVVTQGGNTYFLVTPGTTSSCAGLTGTGAGVTDGSSVWSYAQATPVSPSNIYCMTIEAVKGITANCTAYGTSFGYGLLPRNSSDATMRDVTLRFSGTVSQSCLTLINSTPGTIDHLRLMNWSCTSTGGFPPLNFPFAHTLTNFEIHGGSFLNTASALATLENSAASITGIITGAPRFLSANSAILLVGGTTNLQWSGGGVIDITSNSGANAIKANGASAVGTITVDTPVSINTAVAANGSSFPGYLLVGGSTATITPRFIRGFKTSSPTSTACGYGDIFNNSTPGSGGAVNGWACTTPSTSSGTWTAF